MGIRVQARIDGNRANIASSSEEGARVSPRRGEAKEDGNAIMERIGRGEGGRDLLLAAQKRTAVTATLRAMSKMAVEYDLRQSEKTCV